MSTKKIQLNRITSNVTTKIAPCREANTNALLREEITRSLGIKPEVAYYPGYKSEKWIKVLLVYIGLVHHEKLLEFLGLAFFQDGETCIEFFVKYNSLVSIETSFVYTLQRTKMRRDSGGKSGSGTKP